MESTKLIWLAAAGGLIASTWNYIVSLYNYLRDFLLYILQEED